MKSSLITRVLTTTGFALGAFALAAVAGTWTPAPANPPDNNVDAPINVGDNLQTKLGSLWIGKGLNITGNLLIATGTPVAGEVLTAVDNLGTVEWRPVGGSGGSVISHGMKVFTVSESWTVPAGVTSMKVTAIGAGGGGEKVTGVNATEARGGGGGMSQGFINNIPANSTVSVVVGLGGSGGPTASQGMPSSVTVNGTTIKAGGGAGFIGTNYTLSNSNLAQTVSSGGSFNVDASYTPAVEIAPLGYSNVTNWGRGAGCSPVGDSTRPGCRGAVIIEW